MRYGDAASERKYWGFAMGEGGKYVPLALQSGIIAVGWDLADLSSWESVDYHESGKWEEFRSVYASHHPDESPVKIGLSAGQVWAFVCEMMRGDIVVMRNSLDQEVAIGEITGKYEYIGDPSDGCPYPNRRTVRWIRSVPRSTLPVRLAAATTAWLTVFRLNAYVDELETLITGASTPPAGNLQTITGDDLISAVTDRLLGLSPAEFEEFIGHLLGLSGFTATVTQLVGDKGVDVIGSLDAEGLAEVSLRVQVKRTKGTIGIGDVLQLRGTLGQEDHGAFVCLGRFSRSAQEESQAEGKKAIKLIDGEALVQLILRHYFDLDEQYQDFLPLQHRDLPLVDQFTLQVRQS